MSVWKDANGFFHDDFESVDPFGRTTYGYTPDDYADNAAALNSSLDILRKPIGYSGNPLAGSWGPIPLQRNNFVSTLLPSTAKPVVSSSGSVRATAPKPVITPQSSPAATLNGIGATDADPSSMNDYSGLAINQPLGWNIFSRAGSALGNFFGFGSPLSGREYYLQNVPGGIFENLTPDQQSFWQRSALEKAAIDAMNSPFSRLVGIGQLGLGVWSAFDNARRAKEAMDLARENQEWEQQAYDDRWNEYATDLNRTRAAAGAFGGTSYTPVKRRATV